LRQVGTSSLLIYMMHGHTYVKNVTIFDLCGTFVCISAPARKVE